MPPGTCPSGQFWSTSQCEDCVAGEYSEGGEVTQCDPCADGKTVLPGEGTSAQTCRWGEYNYAASRLEAGRWAVGNL